MSFKNLFNAQSANGDSSVIKLGTSGSHIRKNVYTLYVWGTFGGGTVTVLLSPDNGTTWVTVAAISITSADVINIEARGTDIKLNLAGATSPSLNAHLF